VRFLKAILWEFVQNLPLIAGFIAALALWQQGDWWVAIICMVAGSTVGALVIRFTESKIVKGRHEPWRVTVTNIVVMTVLTFVLVIYLSTHWSSWKTDLLFGALAGVGIAVAQDLAAGDRIGIRHCAALGLSAPLALIGVRVLSANLPVFVNIPIITTVATLIIGLVDYGPLSSKG
jgi:hypothetical protein